MVAPLPESERSPEVPLLSPGARSSGEPSPARLVPVVVLVVPEERTGETVGVPLVSVLLMTHWFGNAHPLLSVPSWGAGLYPGEQVIAAGAGHAGVPLQVPRSWLRVSHELVPVSIGGVTGGTYCAQGFESCVMSDVWKYEPVQPVVGVVGYVPTPVPEPEPLPLLPPCNNLPTTCPRICPSELSPVSTPLPLVVTP